LYIQLKHTPTAAGAALTRALRQLCWRLGISEAELKLMDEEQTLNDEDLLNLSPTSLHSGAVLLARTDRWCQLWQAC